MAEVKEITLRFLEWGAVFTEALAFQDSWRLTEFTHKARRQESLFFLLQQMCLLISIIKEEEKEKRIIGILSCLHQEGHCQELLLRRSTAHCPIPVPVKFHQRGHSCLPTRKCLVTSCAAFLVLGVVATGIAVGITFGILRKPADGMYRQCSTASQHPGFLCEDRMTCLPPSLLCDGKMDCSDGRDESAAYCGQMPNSLPQNLIFKCPNQKTWIYVDRVCDTRNDCGDCSDESVSQCPACSGWRCDTVFFSDCACIPRSRCRNGIQDCADWSDENLCND